MTSNGMGEYIASLLYKNRIETDFHFRGIENYFPDHASRKELLVKNLLDAKSIFQYVGEKSGAGKI